MQDGTGKHSAAGKAATARQEMARTLYARSGNAPPPPRQRSREPTLQRPNKPKPEGRGRPRPRRGAGGGRAPRPGVPASLDARPRGRPLARGATLPPLRVRGRPLPHPRRPRRRDPLRRSRPAIPRARPHNNPVPTPAGGCSPPATASAAGGPRRYRTSPIRSASRAKGCASCSPARR